MARIVALGSALQDIYLLDRDDFVAAEVAGASIFGKIAIGDKVDIDKVNFSVGGGGTNVAASLARQGHETIFMGNIGRDDAGEAVRACLDDENVDTSYLEYVRAHTGCAVVMLDVKSGERTILVHRGASAKFDNLDPKDLELIDPDWLYATTLHGDFEILEKFFDKAHELGTKVMFNPGAAELDDTAKLLKLLAKVDALIVNKREAQKLVSGVLPAELIDRLANYCDIVIITDGSMGAIATDHQETWRLSAYEHVRVRDLNGAGDAFGAGFLGQYANGAKFKKALEFASANAASVISKVGAKAGILDGGETLHPMPVQKLKKGETC